MSGVGHSSRPTRPLFFSTFSAKRKMDAETELETKIKELEGQVTALKKENTKLRNEMRFNLDQEKYVELQWIDYYVAT